MNIIKYWPLKNRPRFGSNFVDKKSEINSYLHTHTVINIFLQPECEIKKFLYFGTTWYFTP